MPSELAALFICGVGFGFEDSFPFPEKSLFHVEKVFNHRVAKSCTITAPVIIVRCALTTDDLVVCRKVVKLF